MRILISAFLLASLGTVACVSSESSSTQPDPKPNVTGMPVDTAGDLTPSQLYTTPAPPVATKLVSASMPTSPVEALPENPRPQETAHTDALTIIAKNSGSQHQIPVDSADESYLFLVPQSNDDSEINATLRGIDVLDPNGVKINKRAPKNNRQEAELLPMSMVPLSGHPAGMYTLKLNDVAVRSGIALDVRQPRAALAMKLQPSAIQHLHGNPFSVQIRLDDAGQPVTGATVQAYLVRPDGTRGASVAIQELGGGQYRADVTSSSLGQRDAVGAYLLDVRAEGRTAKGQPFLRHGRTGFHFGIPTGRITDVSATRIAKNDKGQIEAFEVDVRLESTSMDRLEVSGMLAAVGADKKEHAVASAFTGAGFDAGTHTVTLRFDAGHIKLTKLEGAYALRNLRVYSLGTDSLYQQIAVHPTRFEGIKRDMLAGPKELTPQIKGLLESGALSVD
jgi:hypothetical protein